MTPGDGAGWWQSAIAGAKEVLGLLSLPASAVIGGSLFSAWRERSKARAEAQLERQKGERTQADKQAEQQAQYWTRLNAEQQAWMARQAGDRDAAVARADRAEAERNALRDRMDAEMDALREQLYQERLRVERLRHAANNARGVIAGLLERGCPAGSPPAKFDALD